MEKQEKIKTIHIKINECIKKLKNTKNIIEHQTKKLNQLMMEINELI